MKLILQNFTSITKYYKQSFIFNVLGLSLAFLACYIIYVQTSYEFGFGKVHNDYERIHRVNTHISESDMNIGVSCPFTKKEMLNYPIVEHTTLIDGLHFSRTEVKYETNLGKELSGYQLVNTDTCINKVFDFDMVAGNFDDIAIKNNVIIPLSLAKNIWKNADSAINSRLYSADDEVLNVAGVYRDLSEQSVIHNEVYIADGMNFERFNGFGTIQYFKVTKNATDSEIDDMLGKITNSDLFAEQQKIMALSFYNTKIEDVYFDKSEFASHPTGNKLVTISLILVAFIILIIALVNFINFSIAIAPRRIKAINTYRVLGDSPFGLRVMIVWEAILTVMIAGVVSLGLIELVSTTSISSLIATDISITKNVSIVIIMFIIGALIGAIAGLYPAIYMTSFVPAIVLNGGKSLPKSAHWIRQVLMAFQFTVSITMIIISLFIGKQTKYLMDKDYGYDANNTLVFQVSKNCDKIVSELKKYPNVKGVSSSSVNIFGSDYYISNIAVKNGESIGSYDFIYASYDYPKLMGLEIFEGDDFVETDVNISDNYSYALMNETAKKVLNAEIGDVYSRDNVKIKGFFRDINHKSLHEPITPLMIIVNSSKYYQSITVKYNGSENRASVIENIKKTIFEINNGEEPTINTVSQLRDLIYKKDNDLSILVNLAALIAIFIATIGVVGLISMESQQRIREIAIRKVNGATTLTILKMLNLKFIKLVFISYAISLPIAWYVVDYWLGGFEYRVAMSPWIFIVSGVAITVLTIFLVTIQSYNAATTNPSRAMKY